MPPSSVSGFAGAARVQRLDLAGIAAAEKHGKRLDWSSMQRLVRSAEPLVWPEPDGLDLMALYEKHIEGVFVPTGSTKMLHNIVQFPKDLISEDEPGRMLEGARRFIESVYGPESVVAARIDQDEKGRHVVDVFVVPIYEKITKHTSKRAVSISKHLKDLAKKHGLVDEYNQRVEEKNANKSAERADLRASLIRNKLEKPVSLRSAQNGISDRSDLTRLLTRHRGNSSRRSSAVAGVQRLPGGELDQVERNDARLLVQRAGRVGVQQRPLDRGVRYQVVTPEVERPEAVPDQTGNAARGRDHLLVRGPVRAGAPGSLIVDPNLFMQGVALQSELHLFLRDVMEMEGVQRGRQKKAIGPDWLSAEQLNLQRKREAVEADAVFLEAKGQDLTRMLDQGDEINRQRRENEAEAARKVKAADALLAQRQAEEAEALVLRQSLAEDRAVVEGMQGEVRAAKAEADRQLSLAIEKVEEATASKRQADAYALGIEAWAAGDIEPVQNENGGKAIKYRDNATMLRLKPSLQPAIVQIWEWMTKMAKLVTDRVAARVTELVSAAKNDRDMAEKDLTAAAAVRAAAGAEAAELVKKAANDRREAASDRDDAGVIRKKAVDLLVEGKSLTAAAAVDRDHAQHDRALAATMVTPEARQKAAAAQVTPADRKNAAEALVTPADRQKAAEALVTSADVTRAAEARVTDEMVQQVAAAKVTSADITRAVAGLVTEDLVQSVLTEKITLARAVQNSMAAMVAQQRRSQGR